MKKCADSPKNATAALADGILDTARKNAEATVTTLLYSLGFKDVYVK